MPLLKYFAAIGSVLLALLFVADATMPKLAHPVYVSKFDRDRATSPLLSDVKILTAEAAPEAAPEPPVPHIAALPAETVAAAPAPEPAPAKVATAPIKKKKVRVASRRQPKPEVADNSWDNGSWDNRQSSNRNSWNNNSWNNNSWNNQDSWDGQSSRKSHRARRDTQGWNAYAYAPHSRGQQDSWYR
jgi:hypothetical protein